MTYQLREYQRKAVNEVRRRERSPDAFRLCLAGPTGCVAADTLVCINRSGNGTTRPIVQHFAAQYDKCFDSGVQSTIRSLVGEHVRLNPMQAVVSSGNRLTYLLTLDDGTTFRATPDHEVLTTRGYVALAKLTAADSVIAEGKFRQASDVKRAYKRVQGLAYHPFASGMRTKREGRIRSVPLHRLVAEATANGMPLDNFVTICRTDETAAERLIFLDPRLIAVHHVDQISITTQSAIWKS